MVDSSDWVLLSELSFAVYDLETEETETFDPENDIKNHLHGNQDGAAERAVSRLYEDVLGWKASNINHKENDCLKNVLGIDNQYESPENTPSAPSSLVESIKSDVQEYYSGEEHPLDLLEINGIPDLLVYSGVSPEKYAFIEVKNPPEPLRIDQKNWFDRFDYLPRKIACMFSSVERRDRFVERNSFRELLNNPTKDEDLDRAEMSPKEIASVISDLEVGDRVLFNDRKTPLTVVEKDVTEQVMTKEVTGVKVSLGGSSKVLSSDGMWYTGSTYRRKLWWIDVVF